MTHAKDASSSDEEYNSTDNNHCKNAHQTRMEYTNAEAKPRKAQKGQKSFEELVEESLRLPDISPSSSLPMSMTEILRRSQTQTNATTTNLPQIRCGQVQLVGSDDGRASERKRRLPEKKAKFGRPKRPSPRQQPSSSEHSDFSSTDPAGPYSSRDGSKAKPEQAKWKKKLHRRQSKRRPVASDVDPLNVSGDFRLPALQGVQKIKQRCVER